MCNRASIYPERILLCCSYGSMLPCKANTSQSDRLFIVLHRLSTESVFKHHRPVLILIERKFNRCFPSVTESIWLIAAKQSVIGREPTAAAAGIIGQLPYSTAATDRMLVFYNAYSLGKPIIASSGEISPRIIFKAEMTAAAKAPGRCFDRAAVVHFDIPCHILFVVPLGKPISVNPFIRPQISGCISKYSKHK